MAQSKRNPAPEILGEVVSGWPDSGFGMIHRTLITSTEFRQLAGTDLRIYCLMLTYQGGNMSCFPLQTTIAEQLGLVQPVVSRSIAKLAALGLVVKAAYSVDNALRLKYILGPPPSLLNTPPR